jgi:hypothetical protein
MPGSPEWMMNNARRTQRRRLADGTNTPVPIATKIVALVVFVALAIATTAVFFHIAQTTSINNPAIGPSGTCRTARPQSTPKETTWLCVNDSWIGVATSPAGSP